MSIQALIVDPNVPGSLRIGEVPEPQPGPGQVLIDVHHTSLNYGEVATARSGASPAGTVLGWDAAGMVVRAADDGTGPAVGQRVLTLGDTGGWAQRRVVDVGDVAVVPDEVDLAVAAALPVAAGTALRALQVSGSILGRRVLVTSAAGGVGRFAVQLAAIGGAEVIASVGSEARKEGLLELGAHQVIVGLEGLEGTVDVILDNVGGSLMVEAYAHLAPGGSLQSIGWTSGEPAVFPPYSTIGLAKSLTSFRLTGPFRRDLGTLLNLVAEGRLKVDIGWRGSWERAQEAADALFGRQVKGKAVLDIPR